MKKIILDGYNVIHKVPKLSAKLEESLEEARKALALFVSGWKRKYVGAEACIVFDGRGSAAIDRSCIRLCGIECFFTVKKESADDRIIAIVRDSGNPRDILVISDDNNIRNNCRSLGAKVEYTSFLQPTKKRTSREEPSTGQDKIMYAYKKDEITDYYEEYLRSKGKIQ